MTPPNDLTFTMTGDWYAQAEALLDEHHVVATSPNEATRIHFGSAVAIQAEQMTDVEVCPLYGRFIKTIADLTYTLSRAMPSKAVIEPNIDGVMAAMRRHRPQTKRRYIIWHGADTLAREDPDLFWQVADVMMGVAAEQEYVDRKAPNGPVAPLTASIDVRLWRPTGENGRGYVLDYGIVNRCATDRAGGSPALIRAAHALHCPSRRALTPVRGAAAVNPCA